MKFHSLMVRRVKDDEDIPCLLIPEDNSSVGPDSLEGGSAATSDTGSVMGHYNPEELYRFTNQLGKLIQDENHPQPKIIMMSGGHGRSTGGSGHSHFHPVTDYYQPYSTANQIIKDERRHRDVDDSYERDVEYHPHKSAGHNHHHAMPHPHSTITMNTSTNHHKHNHHNHSNTNNNSSNIITQVDGQLVILNQNSKSRQAEKLVVDLQRRRYFLYWLQVYNSIRFYELLLLRRIMYQWKCYLFARHQEIAEAKELEGLEELTLPSTSSNASQHNTPRTHRSRTQNFPQPTLTYHPIPFNKTGKSTRAIKSTITKESIIERNIKAISKYQQKHPVILKVDSAHVLHTKPHSHPQAPSSSAQNTAAASAPKSPTATLTNKRRMDTPSSSFAKPVKRKMLHPTHEYDANIPFAKSSPPCNKFKLPEEPKPVKRSTTPTPTTPAPVEVIPLALEAKRLQQHFNQVLEEEKAKFHQIDPLQRLRERIANKENVPSIDVEDSSTVQEARPTLSIAISHPPSPTMHPEALNSSNSKLMKQLNQHKNQPIQNKVARSDSIPTSVDVYFSNQSQSHHTYVESDVNSVVTFDDASTFHEPRSMSAVRQSQELKPSIPLVQTRIAMYEPEPQPESQLPPQPQRDDRELMYRLRSKFHHIPEPSMSSFRPIAIPVPELQVVPKMVVPPCRIKVNRTPSPGPIIDPPTPLARSNVTEDDTVSTSPTSPVQHSFRELPKPIPSPARSSLPVEYHQPSDDMSSIDQPRSLISKPESIASTNNQSNTSTKLSKLLNRLNKPKTTDEGNIVRRRFSTNSKDVFSSPEHKKRCAEDDNNDADDQHSESISSFPVTVLEVHKAADDEMSSLTKEKGDERSTTSTISSISQTLAQYRMKRKMMNTQTMVPSVAEGEHETMSNPGRSSHGSSGSSIPPPPPSPRSLKGLPLPVSQHSYSTSRAPVDQHPTRYPPSNQSLDSVQQDSKLTSIASRNSSLKNNVVVGVDEQEDTLITSDSLEHQSGISSYRNPSISSLNTGDTAFSHQYVLNNSQSNQNGNMNSIQRSTSRDSSAQQSQASLSNGLSARLSFSNVQYSSHGNRYNVSYLEEDVSLDQLGEFEQGIEDSRPEDVVVPYRPQNVYYAEDIDGDIDDATSALTEVTSYNLDRISSLAPDALNIVISPQQYEYQLMLQEMRRQGRDNYEEVLRIPERSRTPPLIMRNEDTSEIVNVQSKSLELIPTKQTITTLPRQRVSLRRAFIQLRLNIARSKEHWDHMQQVCAYSKEKSKQRAFRKWISAILKHIAYKKKQTERSDPANLPLDAREANQMTCKHFLKRWVLRGYHGHHEKHWITLGKKHFTKVSFSRALQRWIQYKTQHKELKQSTNVKLQKFSSHYSIENLDRLSSPRSMKPPQQVLDLQPTSIVEKPRPNKFSLLPMTNIRDVVKQEVKTPLQDVFNSENKEESLHVVMSFEGSPILFTSPMSLPPSALKYSPSVHDSDSELAMSSFISNDLVNISDDTSANNLYIEASFNSDVLRDSTLKSPFESTLQESQGEVQIEDFHEAMQPNDSSLFQEESRIVPTTNDLGFQAHTLPDKTEDSLGSFLDSERDKDSEEEDNFMFLSDDSTDASSIMCIEELEASNVGSVVKHPASNWFAIKKLSPTKSLVDSNGNQRSSAGFESIRNLANTVNLLIKMFRSRKFHRHKLYAEGMYYLVQFNLKQSVSKQLHNIAENFHQEQMYRKFLNNLKWLKSQRKMSTCK